MSLSNIEIDQSGSESKLNTISDGMKVIKTIFTLYKNYKPLAFFSIVGFILFALGLIFFIPVFITYLKTGLVGRIPTLVVSVLFFICSVHFYLRWLQSLGAPYFRFQFISHRHLQLLRQEELVK